MKQSLKRLQNWCFPPTCVLTNLQGLDGLDLSKSVIQGFKYQTEICPVCGEKSYESLLCGACLSQHPSFDRTQAFYDFAGDLRELIHLYKYQRQHAISHILATLMLQTIDASQVEAIAVIPLHVSRLRNRGFNQSLELAKAVSRRLSIPLILNGIERIKPTISQTKLSKAARKKNLAGVFQVNAAGFAGVKSLALLDDVMTTGTTMEVVAKQIKQHTNVKMIEAWAIAKTR